MSSFKNPPKLLETSIYETWVKEVKLWALCSKVDKKEQAAAVTLSLEGRAREAALELSIEDLSADDGLTKLITQLDGLFLKDENQRTYVAYAEFEKYKRPQEMSIDNYINDFERLYNKVKAFKIELPDQVPAYRLLESAHLSSSKNELVRATITKLGYTEMKAQLRKLEDMAVTTEGTSTPKIKEEPAETFYARGGRGRGRPGSRSNNRGGRGRGSWRRGGNDRFPSSDVFPGGDCPSGSGVRKNPIDDAGRVTKCFICKSTFHWAGECPHQNPSRQYGEEFYEEEVHITLFAKGLDVSQHGRLLGEPWVVQC